MFIDFISRKLFECTDFEVFVNMSQYLLNGKLVKSFT